MAEMVYWTQKESIMTEQHYLQTLAREIAKYLQGEDFYSAKEYEKQKYRVYGILLVGGGVFYNDKSMIVENFGIVMRMDIVNKLANTEWPKWYNGPKQEVKPLFL